MGATNLVCIFPGKKTEMQIQKLFTKMVREAKRFSGEDPYNGDWNTIDQVLMPPAKIFADRSAAEDWALDHAEKWSHAQAVYFTEEDGKKCTMIAGWAAM